MTITNFGANLRFRPQSHFAPATEEEVLKILEDCRGRKIRAIGRLHSWSNAPREDDVLLDLSQLSAVRVEQREDGIWATIQAGCQIKKAIAELEQVAGVTLPSLGLITEQTIAGAISTGTHGSGKHSLSHYIDEVSIATYDAATGEPVIRTIKGGQALLAARCSLGCMGIILSVGLRCRSQYRVEEHFRIYDTFDDVFAAEDHYPLQQFFLVPHLWKYLAQHRKEVDDRRSILAPVYRAYWFLGIDVGLHLVLVTLTRLLRSRRLTAFFYRSVVPWTIPRGWKVIDKSQNILTMEHELFRHIEIEVFVRQSQLRDALRFVRELLQYCDGEADALKSATRDCLQQHGLFDSVSAMFERYSHHYPICVRKVLPDATLISMASGGDEPYYALSFINYDRCKDREAFFEFTKVFARTMASLFAARPHWGKVCPIDAQIAERLYPRIGEFRDACDAIDANGSFRNQWLQSVVFGKSPDEAAMPASPSSTTNQSNL